MTPAELRASCADALASSANLRAFLAVIRAGEGTSDVDGYRRHYGGRLFDGFADHPRVSISAGAWTSTAAGAYQFLSRTWDECRDALGLDDFSPASQDLAAVFLIRRRGALPDVLAGRLPEAIAKCNREWASLPGSPYGQPTRTLQQATDVYLKSGGNLYADAARETDMPLPAFLGALLPSLASAIPEVVKLIKPDSESAQANAQVAAKVFEVAKSALGAVNEQDVVDRVRGDAGAAQAVRQALLDRWYELAGTSEIGAGGIGAARDADLRRSESDGPWWQIFRSPSFWALLLLLPLVYLVVLSLIGVIGTATWSDDVRSAISGTIVGSIIGGAVGYYWGQSTSRNRAPAPGAAGAS